MNHANLLTYCNLFFPRFLGTIINYYYHQNMFTIKGNLCFESCLEFHSLIDVFRVFLYLKNTKILIKVYGAFKSKLNLKLLLKGVL